MAYEKTVKVALERHLWLNRGTEAEVWFDAGQQFVTELDAALLRGNGGVTFPDEPIAKPTLAAEKPAKPI